MIGAPGACVASYVHNWVKRRFKIDDPVGAIAVHGYAGIFGLLVAGFVLWGYPATATGDPATITPWGQLIGAIVMFGVLGFLPGSVLSHILNAFGLLRTPREVELAGLDVSTLDQRSEQERELVEAEQQLAEQGGAADSDRVRGEQAGKRDEDEQ